MFKHVYIITGASSGLGAELCRQLLSEENQVFGLSRTVNLDIQKLAHDLGFNYQFIAVDLSQVERIEVILKEIFES